MEINNVNNTPFCSRNQTIRYADDICRKTNIAFPKISGSKISYSPNINKFKKLLKRVNKDIKKVLRKETKKLYIDSDNFLGEVIALIKPVKKHKLGNCAESSHLGTIIAKLNGIEDCHPVKLFSTTGDDLDHMVVFVNDKKPYIIDPWLGLADYVNNAISKYKNDYNDIFELEKNENITFASMIDDAYTDTLRRPFKRTFKNKLLKIFPKMRINKYYNNN